MTLSVAQPVQQGSLANKWKEWEETQRRCTLRQSPRLHAGTEDNHEETQAIPIGADIWTPHLLNRTQQRPQQPNMALHFSVSFLRKYESRQQHPFLIPDHFTADDILTSLGSIRLQLYNACNPSAYVLLCTGNMATRSHFRRHCTPCRCGNFSVKAVLRAVGQQAVAVSSANGSGHGACWQRDLAQCS
jgi:hypothetical protein